MRTLDPEDDLVVIIQGMGILALLCRQVPEVLAAEREKLLTEFASLCRKHEIVTARASDNMQNMFSAHQKLPEQSIGIWQSREQQAVQALDRIAKRFEETIDHRLARLQTSTQEIGEITKEQRAAAQQARDSFNRISVRENAWRYVGSAALGAVAVFLLHHFWPH